jgi:hypothetical protein
MNIRIPKQLHKIKYRFIPLGKNSKKPMYKNWQIDNNYTYDSYKLTNFLKLNYNYGVLTGFGKLVVLDFDNLKIWRILSKKLPRTFTVLSGSGLYHLYFSMDKTTSFKILDENKNTLIDIQGKGKQVVGANSIHPNGNIYDIYCDQDIQFFSYDELLNILKRELPKKWTYRVDNEKKKCNPYSKKKDIQNLINSQWGWDGIFWSLFSGDPSLRNLCKRDLPKGQRSELEFQIVKLLIAHSLRDNRITNEFIDYFMNKCKAGNKWREKQMYPGYKNNTIKKARSSVLTPRNIQL